MKTLGTASVAALRQYVRAAESAGVNTNRLFDQAGLNQNILDTDDGRINGEQFQYFIHLLCEQTGNPILGLDDIVVHPAGLDADTPLADPPMRLGRAAEVPRWQRRKRAHKTRRSLCGDQQ